MSYISFRVELILIFCICSGLGGVVDQSMCSNGINVFTDIYLSS